jgi:hypothetical protein
MSKVKRHKPPKDEGGKGNKPQPENMSEVKDMIMRLSEMCDLIGLRTAIIEGTSKGRKLAADPWHNTRVYMKGYADPGNTTAVIEAFEGAGCKNEIEAVRWLLRHDELVP